MNRQIKFRAWDKDEKRMLEVYRIGFDGPIDGAQVYCYLDDRGAKGSKECFYDGDGLTLEQFTGLKDSNGKEIYEGDLVQLDPDDSPYKVIFDEGKFEITGNGVTYDLGEEFMDCEIIGNIHEDKDLLEADK
ncbi:YopX protein [Lentilactobacillus parabuchneri]|uniref:YopX family protein n=1 Tax=Lentilactobacillus parabuchneri TaxID=152331 RepID=UPI000A0FAE9B|nr:YopX family protein [Lentilactobacillus parabuchneri]ORN08122.1 YopX protein [Lentilactobacillus parabuchneri]